MDWCGTGSLLVFIFLVSSGVQSLKPENLPSSGEIGGLRVPWHDELCCDSLGAHITAEERPPEQELRPVRLSQCNFRTEHHHDSSGGLCVDVICRIREDWSALTCELHSDHSAFSGTPTAISLQPVLSDAEKISASEDPVICEGNSSLKCSLGLGAISSGVMLNVTIADVSSSPVHLKVPTTPVKPDAPVGVSHHQTIEAELILNWNPPPGAWDQLRYEVRYGADETPAWKVLEAFETQMLLDLEVNINFTFQIRCSTLVEPPLWSDWSKPHHIHLEFVSYIPEIIKTRPGEATTLYCVFNDRNFDAKSALWTLNHEELPSSQYHPVNQWVSQVTVWPSERHMYELLRCTQDHVISYSQIYVENSDIAITCQTNGDINRMHCSWNNEEWTDPKFKSRWADLLCEDMERREKAGEELGAPGPECRNQRFCQIWPLRMNCYRLWLEMDSPLGPVTSKPIYVSPLDHVKPHTASNVAAVSHKSGVLSVTWDPPHLPVKGVKCQFRFHGPSTVGQPVWREQPPVHVHGGEVSITNMCVSYAVQVRCLPTHGSGHWSDWSETIYSVPQNSQAPERGPDFWRVFSEDPNGNRTTVTLLFEHLQTSGLPYCVDGLIIRHQPQTGAATEERTGLTSSHSFDWNHEVQTVTVETYNSLGRSANNFNITLNKQVKREAVCSFHVLAVNASCVSVSWSVLNSSFVPQYMVLQWTHSHQESHKNPPKWKRLHHTDRPVHIGDLFGPEEYDFYLYPMFADGEGRPVHTRAVKRDPGAYTFLMIISLLSVVLLVTLVASQNQMKRIVWKDVPNPNKCSWAKGVDFKKVDTFEHVLRAPETLPAWPLMHPTENISTVVIMDKMDLSVLVQPPPDTATFEISDHFDPQDNEKLLTEHPIENIDLEIGSLLLPSEMSDGAKDNSAQSSVNYATVQLSDPQIKLHFQDRSACSSCDEGNFSANNSDISDSSHGALWELESCRAGDSDIDKRCSGSSYNSVEELSKSPDQEENDKQEKDLYYLTLKGEDSDEEEQDETHNSLLKSLVLSKDNCSCPLLESEEYSNEKIELLTGAPCGLSLLYLPQFRTAPDTNESQL